MLPQLSRVAHQIQAALIARVAALFHRARRHHRILLLRHTALTRRAAEERRGAVGVGEIEREEGGHVGHTPRHHRIQSLKHHLARDAGRTHQKVNETHAEADHLPMGLL